MSDHEDLGLEDDAPQPKPAPSATPPDEVRWPEEAATPAPRRARDDQVVQRDSIISRVPPNSPQTEEYILSCCLLDGDDSIVRCKAQHITAAMFYSFANRLIFERIVALHDEHHSLDTSMLAQDLMERKQLEAVGGFPYLTQVTSAVPTTAQLQYFIDKLRELWSLRELIKVATGAVERAYSYQGDLPEFMGRVRQEVDTIASQGVNGNGTSAYSVWQPAAFRAYQPPPNLNLLAGGYVRRRQLTTLIGPPGVGKSRLSLWLGVNHICGRNFLGLATQNSPAKWLFFGNENDPSRQKTDLEWFYKSLTTSEQAQVDTNLFLHVIDQPDDGIITLADPDACAKLHMTLNQVKPDVIVFDPWGNMIEGNENDNEEVRKTLKILLRAVAVNAPDAAIIVIHHARTGKSTAIEAGNNFSGGSLGRGSKALVSSARCELALWPGHSEDSTRLVLTCEKVNNVKKFEPKGLLFENGIYREDSEFDIQAWRDDIEGVRGGKTLTIRDLVEIVRAGHARGSDISSKCELEFGISRRTVTTRLAEACEKGYLARTVPSGSYTLGVNKLPVLGQ